MKIEIFEYNFDEASLPVRFHLVHNGETIDFYHRTFDSKRDLYVINLGKAGSVKKTVRILQVFY